ncbi:MAG TPA: ATP-binding protein [Oculatellaceae cyanobacterium]
MKKHIVFESIARGLDRIRAQLIRQRVDDFHEGYEGDLESGEGSDDIDFDNAYASKRTVPANRGVDLEKRAQLEVYQTLWLEDLIAKAFASTEENVSGEEQEFDAAPVSDSARESTRRLMSLLYATFSSLTAEFNKLVTGYPQLSHLRVGVTEVSEVRESLPETAFSEQRPGTATYFRSRTSNSDWSLSIRGSAGRIEFFLLPAPETFFLSRAETMNRLQAVFTLNSNIESDVWMIDGLTVDPDELFYSCRSLFKSLILASSPGTESEGFTSHLLANLEGEALRDTVKQIMLTEQNMVQKIVSQQEEIQNRIARDLHDAVIADIMSLKRGLASDKRMSNELLSASLDQICQKLREICHDLAPRDLKDWGLQTVLDDLVERLGQRTGADCSFIFEGEMPDLPYQVQLHIYRIAQESLNNIEKYAEASRIIVQLEADAHNIKLTLRDNGKGFVNPADSDTRSKREGGTGLSGIKERTEMIRCFFPARLLVVSKPGKGSVTTLEVRV